MRPQLKDMKCFNCQQKGHLAANCPHKAIFLVNNEQITKVRIHNSSVQAPVLSRKGLCTPGRVEVS